MCIEKPLSIQTKWIELRQHQLNHVHYVNHHYIIIKCDEQETSYLFLVIIFIIFFSFFLFGFNNISNYYSFELKWIQRARLLGKEISVKINPKIINRRSLFWSFLHLHIFDQVSGLFYLVCYLFRLTHKSNDYPIDDDGLDKVNLKPFDDDPPPTSANSWSEIFQPPPSTSVLMHSIKMNHGLTLQPNWINNN